MGYFTDGFAALRSTDGGVEEVTDAAGVVTEVAVVVPEYWADTAMFIGANTSMPGWYTVIAAVMLVAILVVGNTDEQSHYKQ